MILHNLRLARPADETDLADITPAARTSPAVWVECEEHGSADCLSIPLDRSVTATVASKIRRRLATADDVDEQRLYDLLATRKTATAPFERLWLDTELAKYGE